MQAGACHDILDFPDWLLAFLVPQDLQAAGFSALGSNIEFVNCSASNVKVHDCQFIVRFGTRMYTLEANDD